MVFAFFFVFSLLHPSAVFAELFDEKNTDLKLGFNARTYPVGAQLLGSLGTNLQTWGDASTWKYGYLRGAVNLATSAVVNRAGLELQWYPISILGLGAGYDWGYRSFTPKYLDCGLYECRGRVDRAFLKANFIAAYQGVILSFNARYEKLTAFNTIHRSFFDEMSLLVGRSSGERIMLYNPALLYTLNTDYRIGATALYQRAYDSGDYTLFYGPVVQYAFGSAELKNWNLLTGLGLNRSPVVNSGWTAVLVLQYTIKPSLNIADLSLRAQDASESPKQR